MTTSSCVGCGSGCGVQAGVGIPSTLPGEPSNDSVLTAVPGYGGVQLRWTSPLVNPTSVAFTKVFRSSSDQFSTAVELVAVSATAWFDDDAGNTLQPYWYWIQHISIYSSAAAPIGPQGATALSRSTRTLNDLVNQIGNSQLQQALSSRINLVSDIQADLDQLNGVVAAENASMATEIQSVRDAATAAQAAALQERNARLVQIGALSAEVSTAMTGIRSDLQGQVSTVRDSLLGQIQGNGSAILNLQSTTDSQAQTITALGTRVGSAESSIVSLNTTTANLASQITSLAVTSEANDAQINAMLTSLYYTKTQADAAIAAAGTTLTTSFDNKLTGYTSNATLTNDYYTKAGVNSAISAATLGLVSTTGLNTVLGNYTTTAQLNQNYYTKTDANAAIASATTNLVSNTALAGALAPYATRATLTQDYYTKTDTDSAISAATLALATKAELGGYATNATLTNNYFTRTETNSAIATATSTLATKTELGEYVTNATLTNNYLTSTGVNGAIASAVSTLASKTELSGYATNAWVNQEFYTKTQTDSAISTAVSSLVSTTALNNALGSYATNASLTQNHYTKTQADTAISNALTAYTSSTQLNNKLGAYATNADLSTNYLTKTDTNSAIAAAVSNLVSTTALTGTLSSYVTGANLTTNYFTKTETNTAISSATQNLVSTSGLNTALNSYATKATLNTDYYTKTQADQAIASATNTLVSSSQLTTALGSYTTTAALQQDYYTRAEGNNLDAQYTLKVDLNGYVSGYGFAATSRTAAPNSEFAIRADAFKIASPTGPGITPRAPFVVYTTAQQIEGQFVPAGTYIDQAMIANGTITNAKIGNFITSTNFNGTVDSAGSITADGTTGWAIGKAGKAVFNDVTVRGNITANSVTANSIIGDSLVNGSLGQEHAYYDPNRVNVGTSGANVWANVAETGVSIAYGRMIHGTVSFAARQTDGRNGAEHRIRVLRQFSDGSGDYICWGGTEGAPITTGYDGTTTSITFFDPYPVAGKFANYLVQMRTLFGDDRIAIVERSMFLRELSRSSQTSSIVGRSTSLPPAPTGYDGGSTFDPGSGQVQP